MVLLWGNSSRYVSTLDMWLNQKLTPIIPAGWVADVSFFLHEVGEQIMLYLALFSRHQQA